MFEHKQLEIDSVDVIDKHKHLDIQNQHDQQDLEQVIDNLFNHILVVMVDVNGVDGDRCVCRTELHVKIDLHGLEEISSELNSKHKREMKCAELNSILSETVVLEGD